jgi:hypothetical protein
MVPQFRYSFLKAIDNSTEKLVEYKEKMRDDNDLRAFQKLFGFLELTDRQFVEEQIADFCFAFKNWDGEPTSTARQEDANEFINKLTDVLE